MADDPGDDFRDLNGAFYSAEPDDYFRRRLRLLMLQAAKPHSLRRMLRPGTPYGDDQPPLRTKAARDRERGLREQFVTAEAGTLRHHAAETLLRLYIAHRSYPPCPWLLLAEETSASRFKATVDELAKAPPGSHNVAIARIFHGPVEAPDGIPAADWEASVNNIDNWLRYFARSFLDEAPMYNAAKHGLALQAGDAAIRIGETGGDAPALGHDGPAISYLEKDAEGDFDQVTRWFDVDGTCFLIALAADLMRNLWAIARLRYLEIPVPPRTAKLFDGLNFAETIREIRGDVTVSKMRRHKVAVKMRGPKGRKSKE